MSVASHTPLLRDASRRLGELLRQRITGARVPPGVRLISGVDGAPVLRLDDGLRKLALQVGQTVDWAACTLVVIAFVGVDDYYAATPDPVPGLYTLGVFLLESAVLTAYAGGSFGKLVTGIRVIRSDGTRRPVDLLRCLLRALLVCLVVPPFVFRPDGRGLHDLAVGSQTARLTDLVAG